MNKDPSNHPADRPTDLSEEASKLLEDLDDAGDSTDQSINHDKRNLQPDQSSKQSDTQLSPLLLFGFAGLASTLILGVIGLIFVIEQRQAIENEKAELAQLEASRLQREQAAREQVAKQQAARDLAAKERAAREEAAKEQAARVQATKELAATKQDVQGLRGLYQAVAIGDHGAWGATWNYDTQQSAEVRAVEICRENNGTNCRSVIWTRNACIALAETSKRDGGFGWAWDESRDSARSQSLRSCQSSNPAASCRIAHQRCQGD